MMDLVIAAWLAGCGGETAAMVDPITCDEPSVYADTDGDGFGDAAAAAQLCPNHQDGYIDNDDDCDDANAAVYPGAPTVCGDGVHNDCDADDQGCGPVGTVGVDQASLVLVAGAGSDWAGAKVAAAGDLTNDGVPDLLVGAPLYGEGDGGAVYLVAGPLKGSKLLQDDSHAVFVGQTAGDQLGWSAAALGDFDGDGIDDVALGAPFAETLGGAVYLIAGGSAQDGVGMGNADAAWTGSAFNAGLSLGAAGDTNGDGLGDVVIGTSGLGAFVMHGTPQPTDVELELEADSYIVAADTSDAAGQHVSGAGDVDGDGLADLIIGAPADDRGASQAGAAYVVLGDLAVVELLSDAHAVLAGQDADQSAGIAVRGLGDVDGDGYDDVAVGDLAGSVYLDGGSALAGERSVDEAWGRLAWGGDPEVQGIDGGGDIDGDGVDDVLVAVTGQVFVVRGPLASGVTSLDTVAYGTISTKASTDDVIGRGGVAFVGDWDSDGYDDLVASMWHGLANSDTGNVTAAVLFVGGEGP